MTKKTKKTRDRREYDRERWKTKRAPAIKAKRAAARTKQDGGA